MTKHPCVYILASQRNGTLYVGVTSNLLKRVWEHRNGVVSGFTQRYRIHHLVYFEQAADMLSAISREKQLKRWKRQWKINLIEQSNPAWDDLYTRLAAPGAGALLSERVYSTTTTRLRPSCLA